MAVGALPELDAQYRLLREGAGLLDRSERGKLGVRGPEAADYLQSQLTNDVEALDAGAGCYALLLDRKGHIQADLRVLRTGEDQFRLDCEQLAFAALHRHLDTYKIGRQVELTDLSAEQGIISLIGPAARELCDAPDGPEHTHALVALDGVSCRALLTDLGADLIAEAPEIGRLRAALLAAGAAEVSVQAAEILRVESGRPRFGAEMSTATLPAEAAVVERGVSFTKGCYIGQETVARLHYKGKPNRHLRGLLLSEPGEASMELRLSGKAVGQIGTATISPRHGPIALAIIRREAEPGTELELDGASARVLELPFEARG